MNKLNKPSLGFLKLLASECQFIHPDVKLRLEEIFSERDKSSDYYLGMITAYCSMLGVMSFMNPETELGRLHLQNVASFLAFLTLEKMEYVEEGQ